MCSVLGMIHTLTPTGTLASAYTYKCRIYVHINERTPEFITELHMLQHLLSSAPRFFLSHVLRSQEQHIGSGREVNNLLSVSADHKTLLMYI